MAPEHSSPRPAVLATLALVVVAATYLDSLQGAFVWDDHKLIEQAAEVRVLQPVGTYFTSMFWNDPLAQVGRVFYRPLVTLSFAVDWVRGDGAPFSFRVTNLLAHLACVALLFALLVRRGVSGLAAMTVSALWGTHPRLTESVAWISGRTDVLAALFGLLALLLWPMGEQKKPGRRLLAAACLLAGLFSKEVSLAFAAAIVAGEWAAAREKGQGWRTFAPGLWPLGLAAVLYVLARASASGAPSSSISIGSKRAPLVLETLGTYAEMVLTPWRAQTQIGLLGVIDWLRFGLGVAVIAVAAAWWWRGGRRPEPVAAVLALSSLALVLHVFPIPVNVVAADRFLYVPLLGLALLAAPALERSKVVLGVAMAAALAFAGVAHARTKVWSSDLSLWSEARGNAHPLNNYPLGSLADAMLDRHFDAEAREAYLESFKVQRALNEVVDRHLMLSPAGRLNLAIAEQRLGDFAAAQRWLDELAAESPEWPRPVLGRAKLELRRLDPAAARASLDRVRATAPQQAADLEREIDAVEKAMAEVQRAAPGSTEQLTRQVELAVLVDATHLLLPAAQKLIADPSCGAECSRMAVAALGLSAPPGVAVRALEAAGSRMAPKDLEAVQLLIEERLADHAVATGRAE